MTFRFSNRVKITASAPGTSAFPATAAVTGFIGFNNIPSVTNGDIIPYTAWDGGANWETGFVTYNSTGPVLTRTTVTQNSAGTFVPINFTGAVTIWCEANAATLPLLDNNGNLALPGTLTYTAPTFAANNGTTPQVVGAATFTKATLGTEVFDTNNNFASSRFTPTVAGYYHIKGTLRFNTTTSINAVIVSFYKNGAEYLRGYQSSPTASAGGDTATIDDIIFFNGTTDYVELWGFVNGTGTLTFDGANSAVGCSMSGSFLHT